MISSSNTSTTHEGDLVATTWLFEQIAMRSGMQVDRGRIRRAIDEAFEAYASANSADWWRWVVEAGHTLGKTSRVVDGDIRDLMKLARSGAFILLRSADGGTWHVLTAGRGRSMEFWTPRGSRPQQSISARKLVKFLQLEGFQGTLRCVIVHRELQPSEELETTSAERTPFARLISLLRPETPDIRIILVFALVWGLLSMATPLAVEALVSTVAFGRFLQPVVILALMLLSFLAFQAALLVLQTFVVEIIQRRLFARIATDLAYRLPRTKIESMDGKNPRELLNRFFDVVTVQKAVAFMLLDGISLLLSVLVGMAVLAFYHPMLLVFDIILVMLMLFVTFVLGHGAVKTSIKESKAKYAMAAWLEDVAGCPTAFRFDSAAEFVLEQADHRIYNYLYARKKHFRIQLRQIIFALATQALSSTVLLGIGGWLVITGELTLGQLVAAELIVAIVVGAFAKMGKHFEAYYDLMASIDKLGTLFDLPMEKQDGMLTAPRGRGVELIAEKLSYVYPNHQTPLDIDSLRVPAGGRAAVTGPSGFGKSTLLDLLFGLRQPTAGRITINGIDPKDLRVDILRRHVALARDIEIFEGTIGENVHLERPDISMQQVRAALETTGMSRLIQELPDGLDTPLCAFSGPLTSCQKIRLMLARAIAGEPDLLLIDGLLDPLPDEEAEQILEELIDSRHSWTLLLVTGRKSLIKMLPLVIPMRGVSHPNSGYSRDSEVN